MLYIRGLLDFIIPLITVDSSCHYVGSVTLSYCCVSASTRRVFILCSLRLSLSGFLYCLVMFINVYKRCLIQNSTLSLKSYAIVVFNICVRKDFSKSEMHSKRSKKI